MNVGYIVSVTLAEFQVWYATGELRLSRSRLLPVPCSASGQPAPDKLRKNEIMDLLPHVDLEDEHSVLLVVLNGAEPEGRYEELSGADTPLVENVGYLSSSKIRSIHPLTRRGAEILSSRMEGYAIKLGTPLFEDETSCMLFQWSLRRSLRGGSALLELCVAKPDFQPPADLIEAACESLNLLNEQARFPMPDQSLLANVMCYDRHDPIPEDDIGYVYDLGVILRKMFDTKAEVKGGLDKLREFCKGTEKTKLRLSELLADFVLRPVLEDLRGLVASTVDLSTVVLFLGWKYKSQRAGAADIGGILEDVRNSAGKTEKENIQAALWLFGFFWGFDRMANDYYARQPERFAFVSDRVRHKPVELPEKLLLAAPPAGPPLATAEPEPKKEETSVTEEVSLEPSATKEVSVVREGTGEPVEPDEQPTPDEAAEDKEEPEPKKRASPARKKPAKKKPAKKAAEKKKATRRKKKQDDGTGELFK